MSFVVRPIKYSELDLLAQMERDCFISPWGADLLGNYLFDDVSTSLALYQDSSIVSYSLANVIVPEAEILRVGTCPQHRGNGHAKSLLLAAFGLWRNVGVSSVWLEVRESNIIACKLYETLGFRQVRRRNAYYPSLSSSLHSGREDGLEYLLQL